VLNRLLTENAGAVPQILYFTSVEAGSGATTVLLNLAICAAEEGTHRIAVLDLNTSSPGVAKRLGVSSGPWLDEVLAGRRGLEGALQPSRVRGLFVLSTDVQSERAVSPSVEAVRWMLSWLVQRFDRIFIDGPVWENHLPVASTDAVFLVVPAEGPSDTRVARIAQEIARQGGRFRGILQTRC
jgi:MinD-like ATPase involved in chromosome partitioning or flagellar assembly